MDLMVKLAHCRSWTDGAVFFIDNVWCACMKCCLHCAEQAHELSPWIVCQNGKWTTEAELVGGLWYFKCRQSHTCTIPQQLCRNRLLVNICWETKSNLFETECMKKYTPLIQCHYTKQTKLLVYIQKFRTWILKSDEWNHFFYCEQCNVTGSWIWLSSADSQDLTWFR